MNTITVSAIPSLPFNYLTTIRLKENILGIKCALFSTMVKLFLCITNLVLCHEDVWMSGCIDPRFLDVSTSSR
jgi:hypothetical protein